MNIGTHLHEQRQRKGISLRQIADSTKVSMETLSAIERNELDRLPGGIFTRGYLRAFAAAVGADPEAIVAEYLRQCPPPVVEVEALPRRAASTTHFKAVRSALALLAPVVGLVVVFAATVPDTTVSRPATTTTTTTTELLQARPTASMMMEGMNPAVRPAALREVGVRLAIRPTENCWISAKADGKLVVNRVVKRGELVTVTAQDRVLLEVGKTGGFSYTINGAPGRPLGERSRKVAVQITGDNYPRFQVAAAAETPRPAAASTN